MSKVLIVDDDKDISDLISLVLKKEGIENFPADYQPYLRELAKKHPNWKFTALYTNLDWNYVINNNLYSLLNAHQQILIHLLLYLLFQNKFLLFVLLTYIFCCYLFPYFFDHQYDNIKTIYINFKKTLDK